MNAASGERVYVIAARFKKALKSIRRALARAGLDVVGETEIVLRRDLGPGGHTTVSRMLFVDCPLLAFEALALDRAAGVYLPLHVLVSPDGGRTRVLLNNPTGLREFRLPPGAVEPIETLRARVARVVESVYRE